MILVTGGTGLLGSHLLYSLTRDNIPVRALKRSTSDLEAVKKVFSFYTSEPEALFSLIEWVNADILDPVSLYEAFEGINQVYHCAAFVSFDPRDRARLIRNNSEGTANLVNTCIERGIEKLCHVSSTSALGSATPGTEITEDMIWSHDKRTTGYSISKFKSEMEVWRGMEEGLNAVIVNPSIILGPGYWGKGSSSLFSAIYRGMRFYTNGVTGYVGVGDVVYCMRKLMDSNTSSERFTISAENLSYREIFTLIAESMGKNPPRIEATPFLSGIAWRMDALRSLFGFKRLITREAVSASQNKNLFSNNKIKQTLGFEFKPVSEVVRETAALFMQDLNRI